MQSQTENLIKNVFYPNNIFFNYKNEATNFVGHMTISKETKLRQRSTLHWFVFGKQAGYKLQNMKIHGMWILVQGSLHLVAKKLKEFMMLY